MYRLAPRIWPQHGIADSDNTLMWPAKQSENNLGHINRDRVSEMREAMVQFHLRVCLGHCVLSVFGGVNKEKMYEKCDKYLQIPQRLSNRK